MLMCTDDLLSLENVDRVTCKQNTANRFVDALEHSANGIESYEFPKAEFRGLLSMQMKGKHPPP